MEPQTRNGAFQCFSFLRVRPSFFLIFLLLERKPVPDFHVFFTLFVLYIVRAEGLFRLS